MYGTEERKFRKDKICSRSLVLQLGQENRTEESNEHDGGSDGLVGPMKASSLSMQKEVNYSSTA